MDWFMESQKFIQRAEDEADPKVKEAHLRMVAWLTNKGINEQEKVARQRT